MISLPLGYRDYHLYCMFPATGDDNLDTGFFATIAGKVFAPRSYTPGN